MGQRNVRTTHRRANPGHQHNADGAGRLRRAWQRIRLTVAEMNYAARRVVELQAPWVVDEQSRAR
jgi:hypothetical protein